MSEFQIVQSLNLHRNRITDKGARELADFLTQDQVITSLDMTRNNIQERGGDALLEAMHNTIRIDNFQCDFGNNLSGLMEAAFEQEIKSNVQIKQNLSAEVDGEITTV